MTPSLVGSKGEDNEWNNQKERGGDKGGGVYDLKAHIDKLTDILQVSLSALLTGLSVCLTVHLSVPLTCPSVCFPIGLTRLALSTLSV